MRPGIVWHQEDTRAHCTSARSENLRRYSSLYLIAVRQPLAMTPRPVHPSREMPLTAKPPCWMIPIQLMIDDDSIPRWRRVSGSLSQQLSLTFERFPLFIFLLHFLTILLYYSFELSLGHYSDKTRVLRSGVSTSFFNFFRRVWGACMQTYCLQ